MKICAATGNAGKLRELRRILEAQGHEVVSQKELGITICLLYTSESSAIRFALLCRRPAVSAMTMS